MKEPEVGDEERIGKFLAGNFPDLFCMRLFLFYFMSRVLVPETTTVQVLIDFFGSERPEQGNSTLW